MSREDVNAAVGLLETLRRNAGFTDGTERNINAIVGFMVGVRLAHLDALTAAVEALPGARVFGPPFGFGAAFIETDDKLVQRAAVLAILRGEQ